MGLLLKEEKENLLTEYYLLREEILDRDYKTWVISIILIIGSLIAAFTPTVEKFPTASLSIVLVASALAVYATSERLNTIAYHRVEEIEKQLRIPGASRMYGSKVVGQWWYAVRKNVAYALFTVLISIYLYLIFTNYYVLGISILAGVLLIVIKEESAEKGRNVHQNK